MMCSGPNYLKTRSKSWFLPVSMEQCPKQREMIAIIHKTLSVSPHQICSEKCMNSKQVIIEQLTHRDNHFKRNGSEEATHLHIFPTLPKYCKSCVSKNWCLHKLSATHLLGTWFGMPETGNILFCACNFLKLINTTKLPQYNYY